MTTWLESLVFNLKLTKPSEYGEPILLGMENFACKVYWFQGSSVVYRKQKVPNEYFKRCTHELAVTDRLEILVLSLTVAHKILLLSLHCYCQGSAIFGSCLQ